MLMAANEQHITCVVRIDTLPNYEYDPHIVFTNAH